MADRAKVAWVAVWVLAPVPSYFAFVGVGFLIGHEYPWIYGTGGILLAVSAQISVVLVGRRKKKR